MKRAIAEAILTIGLSVGIAVAVFAVGSAGSAQAPPPSLSSRLATGGSADDPSPGGGAAPTATPPGGSAGGCRGASVMGEAGSGIRGSAILCNDPDGVRAAMEVDNLAVGEGYTVWLAYFDRPSACRGPRCTLDDISGDDPIGVLGRLDGTVATAHRGTFSGRIRDLQLPFGSQVSLLLFGHGHATTSDIRSRARQLLTPQSPRLGTPLAGAAADGELGSLVGYAAIEIRADP